ncbi:MAG: NAD(P)-dependent alcohol dehydrogenase [candidate division Zixibacteria bacterium]|nr:NAD(P)-dependent alcohol dehydrogenase [candidate division Zixibacteria bacterium]MBU1471305.1 NAD(P)-dependent alcohol dehydrogenase [candidate division Zixibacteria bacterium]MBU2625985.1 NAD(P)-dependent alcohol dehydrogenase [candidate division Zixibacteria bacterium]
MKAIVRTKYGSPDALKLQEIDKPDPMDNQVLVRVHAASVNPLDWHILRGKPFLVRLMGFGFLKPKHQILGADMAGRVEAVGKSVIQFKAGDEVFGSSMGGFAEYACIRESKLVLKPAAVTFEQAAAVPVAGITALQALRDHGRLQSGQQVLIHGASGGVGTFAVQIAKALGAHVTGVCSGRNVEMVRSIGADHVIDYTKEEFWRSGNEYDLIVDNAAFHSIRMPLRSLKPTGIYVGVGGSTSTASLLQSLILNPLISKIKGRKVVSFMANVNQTDLALLKELLEAGKVVPIIDRKYPLSDTPQAIRYVEEGHARGKVVITV